VLYTRVTIGWGPFFNFSYGLCADESTTNSIYAEVVYFIANDIRRLPKVLMCQNHCLHRWPLHPPSDIYMPARRTNIYRASAHSSMYGSLQKWRLRENKIVVPVWYSMWFSWQPEGGQGPQRIKPVSLSKTSAQNAVNQDGASFNRIRRSCMYW
jgi:hypothetical protein